MREIRERREVREKDRVAEGGRERKCIILLQHLNGDARVGRRVTRRRGRKLEGGDLSSSYKGG